MTDPNSTIHKLATITDAALFERLATAVLRSCKPSLYESLSHPGVNVAGKTVKAPLDGVGWVRNANGDRVIAVAHSTCKQDDIKGKWLNDPSTVKPRKAGGKPTAPEGDLHKAIKQIRNFRSGSPGLNATFALTSNREPGQDSIVAAQILATKENIELDIWPASRIAQYLDNSAEGQWIRKTYLGDSVELVSTELLQSCTLQCLQAYSHLLKTSELVDRMTSIEESADHMLLVGSSGVGKTNIALQMLKRHAEAGGTGLVIPQETITIATNLSEAIDIELRKLEPNLQPNSGQRALSLTTENVPFVVVVEDVNAANDPQSTLNKVVGWVASNNSPDIHWQLVCPIWPRYLDALKHTSKKDHGLVFHTIDVYTSKQAEEAIQKRSHEAGIKLLPANISSIAKSLGNDPLLIALYNFSESPDASKVVDSYVEDEIAAVASRSNSLHQSDVRSAIDNLVQHMLVNKKTSPSLREIGDWFQHDREQINTLRVIFKTSSLLRLTGRDGEDILTPRHDRVLLSLFSSEIAKDLQSDNLRNGYIDDPFFAEAVGLSIYNTQPDAGALNRIMQVTPLSLFHAFHLASKAIATSISTNITHTIRDWLTDTESHKNGFSNLRYWALRILAETDAPDVLMLTDLFSTRDRYDGWCRARFRNGDIGAGLNLLTMFEFGVTIPGQDELLTHIFERFGAKLIAPLQKILSTQPLDSRAREGALRLAGYFGNPALAPAINTSWTLSNPDDRNLVAYLWAAARCYDAANKTTLDEVCDAWGSLPDSDAGDSTGLSRSDLAAYGLSWEFRDYLPLAAIPYFVWKATTDERLRWPITYMLRDFDHPLAVEHITKYLADRGRNRQPGTYDISHRALLDGWDRKQRERGIRMSTASKKRLLEIALDTTNDHALKKSAFRVWKASQSPGDVELIRGIDKTSDLYEEAIWARVQRKDKSVIPQLIELIPSNPRFWWQAGRYLWSDELTDELYQSIKDFSDIRKAANEEKGEYEYIFSERLMEIDVIAAERILLQEWDGLKHYPSFIQAALYFATPQLTQLAKEAIANAAKPAACLEHVTMHMGWMTQGRTGITRFEQVKLLCEYADLLSEHDIYALWEICNEHGWIELRKTYLDEALEKTEHFGKRFQNVIDFSDLDKSIEGVRLGATSFWIDNHIRNGKTLPELIDALFGWLEQRHTLKALEIVTDIFHSSARRCDFERLQRYTESWAEASELIKDLAFSVKYRTLN